MERPNVSHMAAVKRILRNVKCSVGCGILFSAANTGRKCNLVDFTDSNWCRDKDDQKSTTGYIFMFDETPISWCSKKELELSSSEGEAVTLLVDNVFVINLSKNPIAHGRSKHIEMRFHYLRELVSDGWLRLGYCRSEDQVADLLTKGVTNDVFKRLKKNMSMVDLKHMN
ncbi:hypothetical protein KIW84_065323 [Lathyrus oleraceus]|uniref:Uncharacterized protein n=1 Tax=Pisum sativum TaxID=3888 RepID=A0A9D4WGF2_PEA|nr:hypothetical protein KIW84_065323 [Pisum sativum]